MITLSPRILIVDDEPGIRTTLERMLSQEGFRVSVASLGEEGLLKARSQRPDLIILDLNLPDLSGEEVCKKIRQSPEIQSIGVMILTGQTAEGLPADCLDSGADDYVSKPFEIREFVSRVRALLRRPHSPEQNPSTISKGSITIYRFERKVMVKGQKVPSLAPKEFDLLCQIVQQTPQVVRKEALALTVWGVPMDQLNARTLDVHIRRIRQKLGAWSLHLKTVPSIGFQWSEEPTLH